MACLSVAGWFGIEDSSVWLSHRRAEARFVLGCLLDGPSVLAATSGDIVHPAVFFEIVVLAPAEFRQCLNLFRGEGVLGIEPVMFADFVG